MTNAINTALSGFNAATTQFLVNANNIANQSSSNYTPEQVIQTAQADGPVSAQITPAASSDIAQQFVQMQLASYDARANLSILAASSKMTQSMLNITA